MRSQVEIIPVPFTDFFPNKIVRKNSFSMYSTKHYAQFSHKLCLVYVFSYQTVQLLASYTDVVKLVTRSSRGTRDKPTNVCVGGYSASGDHHLFLGFGTQSLRWRPFCIPFFYHLRGLSHQFH